MIYILYSFEKYDRNRIPRGQYKIKLIFIVKKKGKRCKQQKIYKTLKLVAYKSSLQTTFNKVIKFNEPYILKIKQSDFINYKT